MINNRTAYQDKIQPFLKAGQQNPEAQQPSTPKDTYIQPNVTRHTERQGNVVWIQEGKNFINGPRNNRNNEISRQKMIRNLLKYKGNYEQQILTG